MLLNVEQLYITVFFHKFQIFDAAGFEPVTSRFASHFLSRKISRIPSEGCRFEPCLRRLIFPNNLHSPKVVKVIDFPENACLKSYVTLQCLTFKWPSSVTTEMFLLELTLKWPLSSTPSLKSWAICATFVWNIFFKKRVLEVQLRLSKL